MIKPTTPVVRWPTFAAVGLLGQPWVANAAIDSTWTDIVPAIQECVQSRTGVLAFKASSSRTNELATTSSQSQWKSQGEDELRSALADCEAREAPAQQRINGLTRKVAVHVQAGEAHPAWDASDRLRLQNLVDEQLRESVNADANLSSIATRSTRPLLTIDAKLAYGGSQLSNRYIDQWIQAPRTLQIHLQLRHADKGRAGVHRVVALDVPAQFRTTPDGNSAARWMQKTLAATRTAVSELIGELKPDSTLYTVRRSADGKLHVDLHEYSGATANMYFLLIPAQSAADERSWQLARLDPAARLDDEADTVALEVADGDTRACAEQTCVAWLL